MMRSRLPRSERAGGTLIEILIAAALFTVVLLSSMAMVESGRRFSNATMEITTVEDLAQQMLFRMEHELANASGAEPMATLTADLGAAELGTIQTSGTFGFPPEGILVVERGTPQEERIAYRTLAANGMSFQALARGQECTGVFDHARGKELQWAGLAEPLEEQVAPSAEDFDGIANEDGVPTFFRGEGVGFSYRVPIDPSGGNNPLNGDELFWGAVVPGSGATVQGWVAHYFTPKDVYQEAQFGDDINRDGDRVDVFEVGQIRRVTWDTADPTRVEDIGLGPSNVIQERCNWGGDLDGDEFDDPMFLWDRDTNLLHVRIFLLGRASEDQPIVRKVESVMFLRNEPEL
jgi:type II secretory pathway component PulJ